MKIKKFILSRTVFVVLFTIFTFSTTFADKYSFSDSWSKEGLTVRSQNSRSVDVSVSVKNFELTPITINGEAMQEISFSGIILQTDEGSPNLPCISRYVAVPKGAKAQISITNYRVETYSNINIAPSPVIPKETEDGPLRYSKNSEIYNKNAFFPAEVASISELMSIRGLDVVIFNISPFSYNPVTKELKVYRDIEAKVTFIGGSNEFGDDRLRSRFFDPIVMDNAINSASIPVIDYNERLNTITRNNTATGCEYLIVVPNDPVFKKWADTIKNFRTEQGILTKVVKLSEIGENSPTVLKDYFTNAYNTWDIPPTAVLLLADYGTNPLNSITSPIYNNYCVSDNIFADVNNDHMPEMVFARMTANNEEQAKVMVTKMLEYERTPNTDASFYKKPITALGWQTERWFQICSEVVGGFFKKQGKEPVRINAVYQGNPNGGVWSTAQNTNTVVNYFGPNGLGYIPASPDELGGWTGGTATDVNNALNAGSFILQHRDHGMETGWGEPDYTNSNINGLTNVGKLSFILSFNCLTGKYNYSGESFAEKFHRYTYNGKNAGCVGITAASEVSYSFVNDTYAWGFFDMMWPEFMPSYGQMGPNAPRGQLPAFANVAGKYFLKQSSWPYNTNNKEVTYHLFHHHGDAFLELYSEVPKTLSVNHADVMIASLPQFRITANAGANIAITYNGQILATATASGAPQDVSLTTPAVGSVVKIVVTKTNYKRYTSYVTVISPDFPFIMTEDFTINDSEGNNDGKADYGEDMFVNVLQKNIGNVDATDVNVTLLDGGEYISFIDDNELYPSIPAQQIVGIDNGFKIKIADNVPDQYSKLIKVKSVSGTETWMSDFTLVCNAPKFESTNIIIDDSQGGNGNNRLDAGETATIKIQLKNIGHSKAKNISTNISITTGLVTLLNNTFNINEINPDQAQYAEFKVEVAESTPAGMPFNITFNAVAGAYTVTHVYEVFVGLLVEDWETNDFTKFEWFQSGNKPWTITNTQTYEGSYSARSGEIGNSATSQLYITYDVMQDDSISFYYKVSSLDPDGLRFYIDNVVKGAFVGETDWTRVSYPVSKGTHVFKWIYYKNSVDAGGQDMAMLDFIVFPVMPKTSIYAGADDFVCEGSEFHCQADGANFSSVSWTTSGTGTFTNANVLRPKYTMSQQDIASGNVTLKITAEGISGTVTDDMVLTTQKPSTVNAGSNGTTCRSIPFQLTDATASNYTNLQWTTSGSGSFAEPNALITEYLPSLEDEAAGSVELTLNASNESCEPVSSKLTLQVKPAPNPVATGEKAVCSGEVATYSTPLVQGNTYLWTVQGGEITSGQNTNSIIVEWGDNVNACNTLSVDETSANGCTAKDYSIVEVREKPTSDISGEMAPCADNINNIEYSVAEQNNVTYEWTINGGEIISGQGTNKVVVNWDGIGEKQLSSLVKNPNCETSSTATIIVGDVISQNPQKPTGPAEVDLYFGNITNVSVALVPNAGEYEWELTPANAGTVVSKEAGKAEITWNNDFRGDANIRVKATNACSESSWSDYLPVVVKNTLSVEINKNDFSVTITPNPNEGIFKLNINSAETLKFNVKIINLTGNVVFEQKDNICDKKYSEMFNVKLVPGAYNVIIQTNSKTIVRKLIII